MGSRANNRDRFAPRPTTLPKALNDLDTSGDNLNIQEALALHVHNPLMPIINVLVQLVQQQGDMIRAINEQLNIIAQRLDSNSSSPNALSAEEIERKRSIVIAGVPESDDDSPYLKWKADKTKVTQILKQCEVESGAQIYRLGKPSPDKTRLIKAVFPASVFVGQALKGQKKMRSDPDMCHQKVFIRPSLTKAQRDAEFQLREEVRRQNANGRVVRINNGKIVPITARNHANGTGSEN